MRGGTTDQGGCRVPAPTDAAASEGHDEAAALRRLRLDVEDLLFERERLKQALAEAQADAVARAEQNAALRRENATASMLWRLARSFVRRARKARHRPRDAGPERPPR